MFTAISRKLVQEVSAKDTEYQKEYLLFGSTATQHSMVLLIDLGLLLITRYFS